jgi:hypothetical protein
VGNRCTSVGCEIITKERDRQNLWNMIAHSRLLRGGCVFVSLDKLMYSGNSFSGYIAKEVTFGEAQCSADFDV